MELPLASGGFESEAEVEALARDFHAAHERVFAVAEPGQQVECVHWKGRLTVALDRPPLRQELRNGRHATGPSGRRRAYFAQTGPVEAAIYAGSSFAPGTVIEGPAVIEEPTTTIVLYPGSSATVTPLSNYLLEVS
jgi:N-methylhydantoinase A